MSLVLVAKDTFYQSKKDPWNHVKETKDIVSYEICYLPSNDSFLAAF